MYGTWAEVLYQTLSTIVLELEKLICMSKTASEMIVEC